jgi:PAS domain S-box-containing protein
MPNGARAGSRHALGGRHKFVLDLAETLRGLQQVDEIERVTCDLIARHLRADRTMFIEAAAGGQTLVVGPEFVGEGLRPAAGPYGVSDLALPAATSGHARSVAIHDVASSRLFPARARANYATLEIASLVVAAVGRDDPTEARLAVASRTARRWRTAELEVIEQAADRASAFIDRARALARLRESEERLRAALEIDTVGVVYSNPLGSIVGANDAFLRMTGFERADIEHGVMRADDLTAPEFMAVSQRAAHELERDGVTQPHEMQLLRVDGSRWWGLSIAKRLDDGLGVEFVIDISEQKKSDLIRSNLEDERERLLLQERRARHQAEEALRARDEFLAAVSHELRTPLAAILLWTRLLASGEAAGREQEAYALIAGNAETQRRLIEDLLEESRLGAGMIALDLQDVTIGPIVSDEAHALRPAAALKDVTLTVWPPDPSLTVRADRMRLGQIVRNLIDNAIRYTDSGGSIEVSARLEDRSAVVEVADSGHGIAAADLEKVFERFWRGSERRGREAGVSDGGRGVGLGLSIARTLVELHGGTVTAHSDGPGHGATFTVRLPLVSARGERPRRVSRPRRAPR